MPDADTTARVASSGIDEALRSRDIAAVGREAVERMAETRVLVSGLNGLGVEIAKNVSLAGVKAVTLHDTAAATVEDLSAQFFLTPEDVGKNRAAACQARVQELNPKIEVNVLEGALATHHLADFTVAVFVDTPEAQLIEYNEYCRARKPPIKFIAANTRGVFGQCFCDFGDAFEVTDTNGENPHAAIVTFISNGNPAVVQCSQDEGIVEFGEGEYVTFQKVEGMTELNGHEPVKVLETSSYCFKIDLDTTNFGRYTRTQLNSFATAVEAKIPQTLNFRSLKDSLASPGEMLMYDFEKIGRGELLHVAFRALEKYRSVNNKLPGAGDAEAQNAVVAFAKEINAAQEKPLEELNEDIIKLVADQASAVLIPMASIFGGIIGQEVMKAVSNKLHPVYQYFYFDAVECLPKRDGAAADEFAPVGSRYDAQIGVFGRSVQETLRNLNLFVVGSGALGCELLKNFAMLGVACGGKGAVTVTDDDIVEKSNLSRQFFFRNHHIGHSKSQVATDGVKAMNADFNVIAMQERAQPASENIFNTAFWQKLDLVTNALDNLKARRYVDSRAVFFQKPLLESGTMGTKCNTQVILPHKTTNYGSRVDPETKEAPECALHNFPHNINHCLSLGRSTFIDQFTDAPTDTDKILKSGVAAYAAHVRERVWEKEEGEDGTHTLKVRTGKVNGLANAKEEVEPLQHIVDMLDANKPTTFDDCVAWARLQFEEFFANRIRQLVHNFPETAKNRTGGPFWSPPKRFPTPLQFDASDATHMRYIMAAANLKANAHGLEVPAESRDFEYLAGKLKNVYVPPFQPKQDAKLDDGENKGEKKEEAETDAPDVVASLLQRIEGIDAGEVSGAKALSVEFEKDDPTNFHMDFIGSFANLRARNYNIDEVDALQALLIAGRIIPALASTTATVTGFVCLEMLKLVQNKELDTFRDLQANLALPQFLLIEPEPVHTYKSRTEKTKPDPQNHPDYEEETEIETIPATGFTVWDRLDIREGDITLQGFIDHFKNNYGVSTISVTLSVRADQAVALFNPAFPNTKANLDKSLSSLYAKYGGFDTVEGDKGYFAIVPLFETADGAEVETPNVVVWYR